MHITAQPIPVSRVSLLILHTHQRLNLVLTFTTGLNSPFALPATVVSIRTHFEYIM